MRIYKNLYEATKETQRDLHEMGRIVKIKSFQNIDVSEREERNTTKEINGHTFRILDPYDEISHDQAYLLLFGKDKVEQHKKWAIEEFGERMSMAGNINPGEAWTIRREVWEEFLNEEGKMDYTYNERFYRFNAIQRIVNNLRKDNHSRRCVLQIYHPDLDIKGVEELKRVPCSVDYSWLLREDDTGEEKLHIFYHMRSCDFFEHFLNDMILASWLNEFVAGQVGLTPGHLVVYINSLHAYKKDLDERNIF